MPDIRHDPGYTTGSISNSDGRDCALGIPTRFHIPAAAAASATAIVTSQVVDQGTPVVLEEADLDGQPDVGRCLEVTVSALTAGASLTLFVGGLDGGYSNPYGGVETLIAKATGALKGENTVAHVERIKCVVNGPVGAQATFTLGYCNRYWPGARLAVPADLKQVWVNNALLTADPTELSCEPHTYVTPSTLPSANALDFMVKSTYGTIGVNQP